MWLFIARSVLFTTLLILSYCSSYGEGAKYVSFWMQAQRDLYNQPVSRCTGSCNKAFFQGLFRKTLEECIYGYCPRWEGFGGIPLGTNANIVTFYAIQHDTYSSGWAVRFQVDFLTNGARIVLVAIPKPTNFPEEEKFTRPFIIGPLIPRSKFVELNAFLAWYGWTCQRGEQRCTPS